MCLDSQDKSTDRGDTSVPVIKSSSKYCFKIKSALVKQRHFAGMLVIKFLSKYLVSIKSVLTKQRHVDESRESGKTQTVQNQVNVSK